MTNGKLNKEEERFYIWLNSLTDDEIDRILIEETGKGLNPITKVIGLKRPITPRNFNTGVK